jgi:hypothetical protein
MIKMMHRQKNNNIEYSPADYKNGWQNDPDYQSLSMGESIVAEKAFTIL